MLDTTLRIDPEALAWDEGDAPALTTVATFTALDADLPANAYHGTIDWGDESPVDDHVLVGMGYTPRIAQPLGWLAR